MPPPPAYLRELFEARTKADAQRIARTIKITEDDRTSSASEALVPLQAHTPRSSRRYRRRARRARLFQPRVAVRAHGTHPHWRETWTRVGCHPAPAFFGAFFGVAALARAGWTRLLT